MAFEDHATDDANATVIRTLSLAPLPPRLSVDTEARIRPSPLRGADPSPIQTGRERSSTSSGGTSRSALFPGLSLGTSRSRHREVFLLLPCTWRRLARCQCSP